MCSPGHKGHDDLTSSPPSSGLSPAVPSESPTLLDGNRRQGLRSLRDLTQHLTTRADDSHAAPVHTSLKETAASLRHPCACQTLVRFLAYIELNHMLHRLCGPPSIPLSFTLAGILPRRCTYRVSYGTDDPTPPTPSAHRLQRGLPGYLILFAPHAFAPQRQSMARSSPSPPVFFLISTDFTPTPGIPAPPPKLKPSSSRRLMSVRPTPFTPSLLSRLHALYAQ